LQWALEEKQHPDSSQLSFSVGVFAVENASEHLSYLSRDDTGKEWQKTTQIFERWISERCVALQRLWKTQSFLK
jgi:hypothetical protein